MGKNGKKKAHQSVLADKNDVQNTVLNIQRAIQKSMHRQENSARMFICKHDLEQIWKGSPSIKNIFPNFNTDECEYVIKECICILSTLVFIGWSDWSLFRPDIIRAKLKDTDLPFKDTSFLKSFLKTSEPAFSYYQHSFTPVVIEKWRETHIQPIPPELYLPFIEAPDLMGKGGYGSVTRRVIAPRCLEDKEGKSYNSEPTPVAVKVYKSQTPSQDFNKELINLDYIKESLTESSGVMKHIAAIVHGSDFMIISPLAVLRDLEIFLREGYEPDPGTECQKKVYDFNTEFPFLKRPEDLRHAVVKEAHRLAFALKWLHEELVIFGSSDRYIAHMDLKPANILVVGDPRIDPQSPAGTWKLSDFGVSSFNKATNVKDPKMPSIHDLGLQLTSKGLPERYLRGRGSYQPPEVDMKDVDRRKCDVWSFGCVLCDILAFAIGKNDAVKKLRDSRYDGYRDDYFYEVIMPLGEEINDSNTKLKRSVVEWWNKLENPSSASWICNYIKVLRKTLRTRPSDRCDIRVTAQGLNELEPFIISQAHEPYTPSIDLEGNGTLIPGPRRPSITITPADSPTDRETRSLPDTVRGNPGQQVVTPNSLSPNPASQREGNTADGRGKNRDDRSSSTENQTDGAVGINVANGVPLAPKNGLSGPQNETPQTENPSDSISELREKSITNISLPKKGHVKAIEIAPSTLQVAVLCQHSVHVFSTVDGKEVTKYNLPSNVEWKKIRLASRYFAVYGMSRSSEKHIKIVDSTTSSSESIITKNSEQLQDILISTEHVFAYIYGRSVTLYFARTKTDSTIRFDHDDSFIVGAKFGASGKYLCIWAMGTKADHAYFVRVDEQHASGDLCGEGRYQKTIANSPVRDIWPCLDSEACIIREAHGGTFLAQPSKRSNTEPQERDLIGLSSALTACVIREDFFVYIKPKMLFGRLLFGLALSQEPGKPRRIIEGEQDLGEAHKSIDKTTAVAAFLVNGKCELVLCTNTGKVLRYVQS